MKKKILKMTSVLCIVVVLLCSVFTQIVSAGDDSYCLLGGRFTQGIENVTCKNNVLVSDFPELYAAVEAAIVDWDWHLSILNERYNVNWNMTSTADENAMVTFCAMSNADATEFVREYAKDEEGNIPEGLEFAPYSTPVGFTTFWNDDESIKEYTDSWNECIVVFLYENMSWQGILDDYYTLQIIVNHEIGHTLGLDEYGNGDGEGEEDTGVIMHPNYNTCTADVPTLADLNGVYEIYKNV